MKIKMGLLFIMSMLVFSVGCENMYRGCKSMKSSVSGLERTVVWTGFDGSVKKWEGKFKLDSNSDSPTVYFITDEGKTVVLGMGWYSEEK